MWRARRISALLRVARCKPNCSYTACTRARVCEQSRAENKPTPAAPTTLGTGCRDRAVEPRNERRFDNAQRVIERNDQRDVQAEVNNGAVANQYLHGSAGHLKQDSPSCCNAAQHAAAVGMSPEAASDRLVALVAVVAR
jgi:hypothetical protein